MVSGSISCQRMPLGLSIHVNDINKYIAAGKHGNLGFVRAMRQILTYEKLPIRINAIAPSWTKTDIVPEQLLTELGTPPQPAAAPARAAILLMADESRNGHLLHIARGKSKEVEEPINIPTAQEIIGKDQPTEDETLMKMLVLMGGEYKDQI